MWLSRPTCWSKVDISEWIGLHHATSAGRQWHRTLLMWSRWERGRRPSRCLWGARLRHPSTWSTQSPRESGTRQPIWVPVWSAVTWSSHRVIVVSVTVLGDLGGRPAVLRSGAKVGDRIAVAGLFGCSAAGLALLLDEAEGFPDLLASHRVPNPPYESAWAAAGSAHSMTDVSDGLIADLRHLAEASDVRFDIFSAAVPTSPDVASAAEALDGDSAGLDPLRW